MTAGRRIQRFSYHERVVHWVVGVTFTALLLSGLALSYPRLFWLTALFGGGPMTRVLHPWIGLVFTVGMGWMVAVWARDMGLDGQDRAWLKAVRHYVRHDRERVPAAGKYNGGQKLFFWLQAGFGAVFLATGVLLWFPDLVGSGMLAFSRLVHYALTLGAGLLFLVHVYLGTLLYPGTAGAMLDGSVTHDWARLHHPRWYRDEIETG